MVLMKQSASGRLALSAILMRWATFRFSGRKRDSLISYRHRFPAGCCHRSPLHAGRSNRTASSWQAAVPGPRCCRNHIIDGIVEGFQRADDRRQRNLIPVAHLEPGLLRCQKCRISCADLEFSVMLNQAVPRERRTCDKMAYGHFVVQDQGHELITQ